MHSTIKQSRECYEQINQDMNDAHFTVSFLKKKKGNRKQRRVGTHTKGKALTTFKIASQQISKRPPSIKYPTHLRFYEHKFQYKQHI